MREILVVTSAYACAPVRTDSSGGGGGGESQGNLTGRRRMSSFKKIGFFNSLSLIGKTIVRQF